MTEDLISKVKEIAIGFAKYTSEYQWVALQGNRWMSEVTLETKNSEELFADYLETIK